MYFVECVNKIKHILSVIHDTICGAECFQFTHFSCDDWENIYTLSYYHHQIGSMNYYPLFRVRSGNNGMRCMSFYILIEILWLIWCKHDMICDIIDMLWSMQYNRHNINEITSFSSLLSLFNSGWSSEFGTRPTNGIPSNSKFDQNLECSGLKYSQPITMKLCTRHDSVIVVMCAIFRCNRPNTL